MSQDPRGEDGQLHTLGLLEELRDQCNELWGTSSEIYRRLDSALRKLANPNLHDIANMSYRVELWEREVDRIRWTLAASGSIVLARAAFDAAVTEWPHERFTLRQGIMTIREHPERPRGR
jgi:hypothetical protein